MGQAKHKKQFFKQVESALRELGALSRDPGKAHSKQAQEALLEICGLVGARWSDPADPWLPAVHLKALQGESQDIHDGWLAYLDALCGALWPSATAANPETELMLAVAVRVLPTASDVIGEFDDTLPLQAALQLQFQAQLKELCEARPELAGATRFKLTLEPALHDVNPHEGLASLLSAVSVAKADRGPENQRQSFRFGATPAVAPVVRVMWAKLQFENIEDGQALLALMGKGQFMKPPIDASLFYTLKAFTHAAQEQALAGIQALWVGLPASTCLKWAFHESEVELIAGLRQLLADHNRAAGELQAKVVVVQTQGVALPEGVVGGDGKAAPTQKSDPQIQVVFCTKPSSPELAISSVLGRVMFARTTPAAMQATLQAAVLTLAKEGVEEVEVLSKA